MATFKHISSKNADYGAAEQYLTFEHDEFTMKPTLDKNGQIVPRTGYLISSLNCGDEDFAIACMVDREAKRAEGKGIGYDRWAAVHNLKQMAATMSVYEESGFSSPEELEAALAAASAELSNVHAELKAVESTLREKKDLQKQLLASAST